MFIVVTWLVVKGLLHMVQKFSFYALLFLLFNPFSAYSKETIAWQTYHRPPGTFNYGEYKGQGFVQKILQMVTEKMPEYNHEMPITTLARAIADINAGLNVCHPALYITAERKKSMYFSNAAILNATNRIIAKPESVAPFLENNQVNLEKLLKNNSVTVGHVQGRSYGNAIDAIFTKHSQLANILPLQNIDLTRVFKLLERDRVDITIAYPFEIQHYLKNHADEDSQLAVFAIAKMPPYDTGAVACPKNKWGKKVINKVNSVLAELKPTVEYKQALTAWREADQHSELFQQYYEKYFLKH